MCKAVFTVLPHFVLPLSSHASRGSQTGPGRHPRRPQLGMVCNHLNISLMALYRLICALGQHRLVTVLVKCRLTLPVYILADEKHRHCLTERVYWPTTVSVIPVEAQRHCSPA